MDVGLLLGCNCPRAIKPREVILGKGEDPYTVRTLLRWGIIGPVIMPGSKEEVDEVDDDFVTCNRVLAYETGSDCSRNIAFVTTSQTKEEITPKEVKMMFEADFSEKDRNSRALSQEDRRFLAIVEQGIHHCEDGHYELPLPLKETSPSLPNNQEVAVRRLSQLKRRSKSDQKYKEDYTTFMENLIKNGHAERVPPDECLLQGSSQDSKSSFDKGNVWYIPHHGIYHPKKPNKIRVVFDCSAEFKNETLNKHLL